MTARLASFSRELHVLSTGECQNSLCPRAQELLKRKQWGTAEWKQAWELVNLDLLSELNLASPPFCSFREVDGAWGFYVDLPQLEWACGQKEGVMKVYAGDVTSFEAPPSINYFAAYTDNGDVALFDAHTKEQIW